jgi:hypothetical protein
LLATAIVLPEIEAASNSAWSLASSVALGATVPLQPPLGSVNTYISLLGLAGPLNQPPVTTVAPPTARTPVVDVAAR